MCLHNKKLLKRTFTQQNIDTIEQVYVFTIGNITNSMGTHRFLIN